MIKSKCVSMTLLDKKKCEKKLISHLKNKWNVKVMENTTKIVSIILIEKLQKCLSLHFNQQKNKMGFYHFFVSISYSLVCSRLKCTH